MTDKSDFFKWIEVGFSPSQDQLYFDNVHLTLWQVDERKNGTPDGWGVAASLQKWIDNKWLPFIRGGYAQDSGSLLEKSISAGLGYQPVPHRGVIGVGLNWGKPNQISFDSAEDQYSSEIFWRYQLTKEIAVTPSFQYIHNPALNPNTNHQWIYGIRFRAVL